MSPEDIVVALDGVLDRVEPVPSVVNTFDADRVPLVPRFPWLDACVVGAPETMGFQVTLSGPTDDVEEVLLRLDVKIAVMELEGATMLAKVLVVTVKLPIVPVTVFPGPVALLTLVNNNELTDPVPRVTMLLVPGAILPTTTVTIIVETMLLSTVLDSVTAVVVAVNVFAVTPRQEQAEEYIANPLHADA